LIAYRNGRVMTEKAGAYGTTTSSMRIEIEAATEAYRTRRTEGGDSNRFSEHAQES
jgi:hypothetical protein